LVVGSSSRYGEISVPERRIDFSDHGAISRNIPTSGFFNPCQNYEETIRSGDEEKCKAILDV
jgi:hypothetical protein